MGFCYPRIPHIKSLLLCYPVPVLLGVLKHLLAISGLHLGILLVMSLGVSQWLLGRRSHLYLFLPFVAIWLYALISGMSPSVTRAAIMGTVYLFALLVGRPRNALPALGFAAAVMVAISPNVLWSVSFQHSVAAMAGIAVLAEPLATWARARYQERLPRDRLLGFFVDALAGTAALTVASTLATLPLVVFYFRQVPLVGIPATALTLPALPFVLVTQAIAGLVGLGSTAAAQPFGWPGFRRRTSRALSTSSRASRGLQWRRAGPRCCSWSSTTPCSSSSTRDHRFAA